jgi:hypothetical protein
MSHSENFLMIATCNVGRGNSICFWSDTWNLGVLKWQFPQLFSFAKNQNISVEKFLSQDVYANFSTPLTVEAAEQWIQLSALLHNLQSTTNGDDHWSYIWGSPVYTPKSAYKQLQGLGHAHLLFKWLWKTCCRGKHKFFF